MSTPTLRATDTGPWYREPWPWALMSGPFIVVVAGLFTAYLAVVSNDGLVTEEYYKRGLAVNLTIAQSELAQKYGLTAGMSLSTERMRIALAAQDKNFVPPAKLVVTISHPTRAGTDQSRTMTLTKGGYEAAFQLPAAGHWLVQISDEAQSWRLLGNVILPSSGVTTIGFSGAAERMQKE